MAGDTDFVALYAELGLRADCTAQELKLAYRRRVGELHPDRVDSIGATGQLQQLNRLYEAAMEFQRLHGRLPGAARPLARGNHEARTAALSERAAQPRARRARWRYVLPAALGLALVLLLPAREPPPAESVERHATASSTRSAAPSPPVRSALITIGMASAQAREIQGEPLSGHDERWDYGPSWIALRCGKVTDWYSSPLRPLRVATPAAPVAQGGADKRSGC
jgi:hypothetical protein